jgi:putative FmdB family regulatory protein
MPIYEFECKDCIDSRITVSWNINDNIPNYNCSICGHTMVRVYSAPAVTFKGTGFYKTDK